jgi:hypothetical protein
MSKANPFTNETVERALALRTDEGLVRRWSFDGKRYKIDVFDFGHFEGTLRETWALVVGMRAAQVHLHQGRPTHLGPA